MGGDPYRDLFRLAIFMWMEMDYSLEDLFLTELAEVGEFDVQFFSLPENVSFTINIKEIPYYDGAIDISSAHYSIVTANA